MGWRGDDAGARDVDASHHAGRLFLLLLLFLVSTVPHAALRRILVRAVEARLVEGDLQLQRKTTEIIGELQDHEEKMENSRTPGFRTKYYIISNLKKRNFL